MDRVPLVQAGSPTARAVGPVASKPPSVPSSIQSMRFHRRYRMGLISKPGRSLPKRSSGVSSFVVMLGSPSHVKFVFDVVSLIVRFTTRN